MLDTLKQVLSEAHSKHVYVPDIEQYGKTEHWVPGLKGDCEDFALWCRDQLKEKGIDSRLVYCRTETGDGHCVLSCEGYILDNRHWTVQRNDELPYNFIAFGESDGKWYAIKKGA